MKRFEVLDHTADIGLTIYGKDLAELFDNAGRGFFHLITDLRKVKRRTTRKIELAEASLERLMVAWLTELLYLHDVEGLLFRAFQVDSVGRKGIKATAKGEVFEEGVHVIKTEVKAVTYHGLEVRKGNGGWRTRIIFDL